MPRQVEAAGGVLWRGDPASPEVALVHRPRYDDWSLPKGKLDPGEHPLLGALREIEEETGVRRPAGAAGRAALRYGTPEGRKRVRYWACEAVGGEFEANREVDELWWGPLADARPTGSRPTTTGGSSSGSRPTPGGPAPLVVVRHASAGDKKRWDGPDADRPLDADGAAQAETIAALLSAYGVQRAGTRRRRALPSRPWRRTPGPPASRCGPCPGTTAGGFEADPERGTAEVAAPAGRATGGRGGVVRPARGDPGPGRGRLAARLGGAADAGAGGPGLAKGALAGAAPRRPVRRGRRRRAPAAT